MSGKSTRLAARPTQLKSTQQQQRVGAIAQRVDVRVGRVVAIDQLTSVERIIGTDNGDQLVGNAQANTFLGGGGFDNLSGGDGNDTLDGGSGSDLLIGGRGFDTLTGGTGQDFFEWSNANELQLGSINGEIDRITDFQWNDTISLDSIDANTQAAGNNAFTIVDSFTGVGGQLRVNLLTSASGGDVWLVSGDRNGDGQADFNFEVTATNGLDLQNSGYWDL